MYIYIMLLLFWLLSSGLLNMIARNQNKILSGNDSIYLWICGVSLGLVMGLRHISVGTDTSLYLYQYENQIKRSSEFGIVYLNRLLIYLNVGEQFYLVVLSFFIIFVFSFIFKKYSKSILISFYLHVTIGMFAMSMSGLRQTLAVTVTIIAFVFLMKDKKILFILLVLLATFFHNTAIVFLSVIFFRRIRITRNKGLILLIVASSSYLVKNYLGMFMNMFEIQQYTEHHLSSAVNPLVLLVSIFIPLFCLVFWPNDNEIKMTNYGNVMSVFLMLSIFNILINIISSEIFLASRMTYYFVTYSVILLSNTVSEIKNAKLKKFMYASLFITTCIMFMITTSGSSFRIDNYLFFWE